MNWTSIAGITGALGVGFGAFGAHALRGHITDELMSAYHTAVQYHLLHAVALLGLALYARSTSTRIDVPAGLMLAGIVLFSGSLYAMALTGVVRLGIVTPIGGVCLIAGWLAVAFALTPR